MERFKRSNRTANKRNFQGQGVRVHGENKITHHCSSFRDHIPRWGSVLVSEKMTKVERMFCAQCLVQCFGFIAAPQGQQIYATTSNVITEHMRTKRHNKEKNPENVDRLVLLAKSRLQKNVFFYLCVSFRKAVGLSRHLVQISDGSKFDPNFFLLNRAVGPIAGVLAHLCVSSRGSSGSPPW